MARIFISHSNKNDHQALALQEWLLSEGWSKDDIYLDISPDSGMQAGQRWVDALDAAQTRCEVVVFLVSKNWLSSKWCKEEYVRAKELNKTLFALIIDDADITALPQGLIAEWQVVFLAAPRNTDAPTQRFETNHPINQSKEIVRFTEDGLTRLKGGLIKIKISPESFGLHEEPDGPFGWRAPYRGLEPLDVKDAAVFFGRDAEIVQGLDMLRGLAQSLPPRLMVVLGASGSGKSSYMRAGLLPRLMRDDISWLTLNPIRTGESGAFDAQEGLLRALAEIHDRLGVARSHAELRIVLASETGFIDCLKTLREVAAKRILLENAATLPLPIISLDQAEEFFTPDSHPDTSKCLKLMRAAMDAGELLCIATIRSDRYSSLQSAPELDGVFQTTFSLPPLAFGELTQVVNGPADVLRREVGSEAPVFSPEVSQALMEEMSGQADSLPLLAFTMDRLMREHMVGDDGEPQNVITKENLKSVGGVARTIEIEADKALNAAGVENTHVAKARVLRETFVPRLARINRETRTVERRVTRLLDFKEIHLQDLIGAFVERRLLTLKGDSDGTTVEVAHEALLRVWPSLAALLEAVTEDLLRLDGVITAAKNWENNDRHSDYIDHRAGRLQDVQSLSSRSVEWQSGLRKAAPYLQACQRAEAKSKYWRRLMLGGILASLVIFATQLRSGAIQKQTTKSFLTERSELLIGIANGEVEKRNFSSANAILLDGVNHAQELIASRESSHLKQIKFLAMNTERAVLSGHEDSVTSAVFSPNGNSFVTVSREKTARLWDATGASLAVLSGHDDDVTSATFSPDGSRIVTASDDKTARLWDATGASLAVLSGHEDTVDSATFSPDGSRIVTASGDKTARLWNAKTGASLAVLSSVNSLPSATGIEDNNEYFISPDQSALLGADGDEIIVSSTMVSASFSRIGSHIVTVFEDKTARLWDAKTGAFLAELSRQDDDVTSALFNSDGTRIVTVSDDGGARLWDVTGTSLAVLSGREDTVDSATFSPDGSRIVTTSEFETARLWNAKTGASLAVLSGHESEVTSATFSPDGTRIVTTSDDGTARLWNSRTGASLAVLSGHEDTVDSATFSPDGTRIVTTSYDGTARLWNSRTRASLAVLSGYEDSVDSASFSADGTQLVTLSNDMTAGLWDATTGREITTLSGHTDDILSAVFSPDGTKIVTTSNDATARMWDTNALADRVTLFGHHYTVYSADFNPDGSSFVTVSTDATARLWDAKTGIELAVLSGHDKMVHSAVFSPDGASIVTASSDKTARVWDAKTGSELTVLSGHDGEVRSAAFSADGASIVTAASDNTARMWDAKTGTALAVFRGYETDVTSASFSPDGTQIVTTGLIGTALLWDSRTGALLADLSAHDGAAFSIDQIEHGSSADFSPDGTQIVTTGSSKTALLWDLKTGASLGVLSGHMNYVTSAKFSPDGASIVTAAWDHTARVWDAKTGTELAVLSGHKNRVTSATFSANGLSIITASLDSTARVWDSETGVLSTILSGHTGGITTATFSPNATKIVTDSYTGPARLWDVEYFKHASVSRSDQRRQRQANEVGNPLSQSEKDDIRRNRVIRNFAMSAKMAPRCLTPLQRKDFFFPPDPPCWCQEKTYPAKKWWAYDYLDRHPKVKREYLANHPKVDWSDENAEWLEADDVPNPFTHPREDGWTCPVPDKEGNATGYSAPWNEFEDLKALSVAEILGPADEAYAKLERLGIK